ncbi:LuxR family transcriptional regulator [Egibacter rhizosphaerae]|uniref:LuxR family transcriptional regulator n=1 Tax=Egibacter rhizosphaerae TaxID=1670831 RepID=A0A411YFX9_9ACTN|nr:LuxR family transcriptional regulator [Egibacter rhizosphaerae]QBI20096.1 LuxR family transcriptional regulator [Egibacter rhizosphaerae]
MAEQATAAGDELAAGRDALARGAWEHARTSFESVLEQGENPAALEGLSWVHWWQEDLDACLAARDRAFRAYRVTGDRRGAARMALWAGDDHLFFRGAGAVADGWFARARKLLDDLPECPEHGWLAVFEAHVRLRAADLEAARGLAREAQRIGRAQEAVDLEMFGLATEGTVRLEQGAVDDGLRCLDEAAAAALAGEYEQLAPAAWACCLLLSACEELRDVDRGAQWSHEVIALGHRLGGGFVLGNCRAHHGSILTRCGRWDEAERELTAALRSLPRGPVSWQRDAAARLGELRRRQGRYDDAARAFEQAGEHPLALVGLAELRLGDGDAAGAAGLAERGLRQTPAHSPRRADALEVAMRCRIALGELDTAAGYTEQLRAIAEVVATGPVRASARLAEARLFAARGEFAEAGERYADAVAAYEGASAPLEAAQARLELARAFSADSQAGLAEVEARRAHAELSGLGAQAEAARAAALVEELGSGPAGGRPAPLTARQVEVLRLAAEGLTEQEIAARLVLSEHTVHRHLANIYTRLGCSSRAAAVARAGRLGVL